MSDQDQLVAPAGTTDTSVVTPPDQQSTADSTTVQPAASTPTFFDPASLAPELQGRYQEMQTAFTQKTQALAEERRQIAELQARAAKWDALSQDQSFTSWLQTRHQPKADTQPAALTPEQMATLLTDPAQFDRYITQKAESIARAALTPVRQQTEQFLASQELKSFASSHPDYAIYRDAMIPMVEQGYKLDDAYKLAKHDVLIRDAVDKAVKDLKAKAAGGSPETKSQSPTRLAKHGKKMSWDEAVSTAESAVAAS